MTVEYVDPCVLVSRQEVAVEVQKDATVTVVFKEISVTGATTKTVTVGTIPKAIFLSIREKPNRDLVILDGAKVLFKSTNGGSNWSASP
jgi:hypothetical protein